MSALRRRPLTSQLLLLVMNMMRLIFCCRLLTLLCVTITKVAGLVIRTPLTQDYLKAYARGKNPVQSGGWYQLEQDACNELAKTNFAALRANLPKDFSPVQAGGWHAVQRAAADPKGILLQLVQQQISKQGTAPVSPELLNALVALLKAQGKGFDSELVDGEWALVFQKQGTKSPKFQKLVAKREKPGSTDANFDTDKLEFYGSVKLFKGLGTLKSKVQYKPVADNFDKMKDSKKVVLRRIACDITGGSWKFWKLPTVPLPLKKSGGYLDFVYLDQDIRITTGSRGGLFVHARPACVQQLLR